MSQVINRTGIAQEPGQRGTREQNSAPSFMRKCGISFVPLPLNTLHTLGPRLGVSDAAKTYSPVRGVKEAPLLELKRSKHRKEPNGGSSKDQRELAGRDRTTPRTLRFKKTAVFPGTAPG
jgi:hypothetical protein